MSRADDLADIESGLLAMRGRNNVAIMAAKALTASETGFLLLDAAGGGFTLTLPPAIRVMDVRVQRVDNSGNRLVIQAFGAEKVMFHTHLRAEGYPFFVLMGAGDFWHLRSDGNGAWRVIDRLDGTPLGRPVFETTTAFQPGGWGAHNGFVYNRSEWPWLWDHAQQSGMLVTEALRSGMEGGWTSGDGALTFRGPEIRGEFLRACDESRGIDNVQFPGTITANSPTVSAIRFPGVVLSAGMSITGAGIPAGTTIIAVNVAAGTLTMSANATANASSLSLIVTGRVPGSRQNGTLVNGDMDGVGGYAPVNSPAPEQPRTSRGEVGWDAPVVADYPSGIMMGAASAPGSANYLLSSTTIFFGVSRPRNVAYPARIKMI